MSISRKITGDASGGSGGSSKYVDDVFSTYLYEGTSEDRDIVNGIELGSRPPGMTQSVEWPVGAGFSVQANGAYVDGANWSIDYWCKFTVEPTTTMVIYDTRTNDANSLSWRLEGGELKLVQGDRPAFDTGYFPWVDSPNEWSHHVITLSDGVVSFFVNGTRVATQATAFNYKYSTSNIGHSIWDGAGLGGCLLSNFRITISEGFATDLTFPVPEGPSKLHDGGSNLLFTESDVAPGTVCLSSSFNTDPVLYDRARGENLPGSDSQSAGIYPIASADSPYPNSGYEGKGGLVWIKSRTSGLPHFLFDTERGANRYLKSNETAAEEGYVGGNMLTAFNSDGFNLGDASSSNGVNRGFTSWTFAKQEGFFDVVTWTGDYVFPRQIPHNLGSTPGMVIIKKTSGSEYWMVRHSALPELDYIWLNENDAAGTSNDPDGKPPFEMDATHLTFDSQLWSNYTNGSGAEYVAYLFADDAPMFGPDGDESIIKCGSYSNASSVDVDLGWEPQWLLIKDSLRPSSWNIIDTMRGWVGNTAYTLAPDSSDAEFDGVNSLPKLTPTGFTTQAGDGTREYIYMAIRRPNKPAEEFESEELFALANPTQPKPAYNSGFPVDFAWNKDLSSGNNFASARLIDRNYMILNTDDASAAQSGYTFDYSNGWSENSTLTTWQSWMFRRAPGFFDMTAYKGDYVYGRDIPHNLGAVPEMMWVKSIDGSYSWNVYTAARGGTEYMRVDGGSESQVNSNFWQDTDPTAEHFTVSGHDVVNGITKNYMAMLWASVPGICDIGNYTGIAAGNAGQNMQDIDCGFTNGSRFVLVKRTNGSGNWYFVDSLRGIVVNSPTLMLNSTQTQQNTGYIQPFAGGFRVDRDLNLSGYEYIYMAIA